MAMIPALDRDASVADVTDRLRREGCCIVEALADSRASASIDTDLRPFLEGTGTGHTRFEGFETKRINGLLVKAPAVCGLALHPLVLGVVDAMLSPYCARFQLNYEGLMHLLPGEQRQPLHRDGVIYPFRHPAPPYTIACMWAQTDFTTDNGATVIAPGSHQWSHEREATQAELAAAAMPRGSLLFYTGGVLHGGGANHSGSPRTGIALQYSLGWLRQELNMYLTYPPATARALPDAAQRLIGYEFGGPYLGFIEDGSPHVALEDGLPEYPERSTPEVDAAMARVRPIPFGPARAQ